jgi:hypothetical protein
MIDPGMMPQGMGMMDNDGMIDPGMMSEGKRVR